MSFKPMLSATIKDLSEIKYPVYASPKLDGIRGVVIYGKLHSRSLKNIPNPHVDSLFSKPEYSGLDGELILGSPTAKDVYRVTNSACSRETGTPDVKFWVFDNFDNPNKPFLDRLVSTMPLRVAPDTYDGMDVKYLLHPLIKDEASLLTYETECLELGYEGLILRSPEGAYKFGRSTIKEQGMMKLKRFTDGEAVILNVYEELENTNEKKTNELGRGARSSHKAGKIPKGRAGGFEVEDVLSNIRFSIGSGLNDEDKEFYWKNRTKVVGKLIKYKSFQIGVKDKPRHPIYLGGREKWDL